MSKAKIYYHDIGDYLNREEKLGIIQKFGSVENPDMSWQLLQPNEHGDWLNLRDDVFGEFIPLRPENKDAIKSNSFFTITSNGIKTNRDSWVYNSAISILRNKCLRSIEFFNEQSKAFALAKIASPKIEVEDFIDPDPKKISWTRALRYDISRNKKYNFKEEKIQKATYRPFFKQMLYSDRELINDPAKIPQFFPSPTTENRVICVSGVGVTKEFSCVISDIIPDLELIGKSQCFPLYYYEERTKAAPSLFDAANENEHIRRDGVSDFIITQARSRFGERVTKEDVFYYVYGFLHSPDYRSRFSSDLKKMLPRLPLVEVPADFWKFSKAGRLLADLHIGYDDFNKAPSAEAIGVTVSGEESGYFHVEKMRFPSKADKSKIIFNSQIVVENIPASAYAYQVNGKSAIEWVMERYAITTHKDSGIKNDPNDWAAEVGNPRYILDLLLSVIRLSVETVEVVRGLPGSGFVEGAVASPI